MEATRRRFESLVEWAVAVAFIAAVLGLGSIVREFRTVSAVTPVIAREPIHTSPVPEGVPSRAVSVPMLLLHDGKEIRVGDSLVAMTSRFTGEAEVGKEIIDRAPNGERLTRFYEHEGTQFVLVFEPFEAGGALRVAGIYLK